MDEVKGLRASVLVSKHGDCSNEGLSSRVSEVTVVGMIGERTASGPARPFELLPEESRVFEASDDAPAVALVYRTIFGKLYVHAAEVEQDGDTVKLVKRDDCVGPMASGAMISSSDSRFVMAAGGDGVKLHDRFETVAQYATYD